MSARMLAAAIAFAAEHHKGQLDKGGKPYILHPLKVMHYLKTEDMELMCVAVLHDVVEDCGVTFSDLRDLGMSDRVTLAVCALTKMPGQTLRQYTDIVRSNPDAVKVKLADLRHNMDARRLKGVSDSDKDRMDKYCKMYWELKELI